MSRVEIPTPASFLETVTGLSQAESKDRTFRLGTVDPSYSGTGQPKIIFDGESAPSTKTYPYAGYMPTAGDRVVLAPVGNTYVILGAIGKGGGGGPSELPTDPTFDTVTVNETVTVGDSVTVENEVEIDGAVYGFRKFGTDPDQIGPFTTQSYVATFPAPGTAFVAPSTGSVLVTLMSYVRLRNNRADGALGAVFCSTSIATGSSVGLGTTVVEPDDAFAVRIGCTGTGNEVQIQGTVLRPVTGLTPGNTYNVFAMHKVGRSGLQGWVSGRTIIVEPW